MSGRASTALQAPANPPAEGRLFSLVVPLALSLFAIAARVWVQVRTHSTTEDFLITLRYAENLASGQGFVYNPGERVLGTTTPLYTLFLASASVCGLHGAAAGKSANILADSAVCFLLCRLGWRLGRPKAGWLAALLYAASSAPVNFAGGGMETGLVTLASIASLEAFVARSSRRMWICLALLALLRIDGLLIAAILGGAQVLRDRQVPWRDIGIAAAILFPWVLFAVWYFGSPLPTSMVAKLLVYARREELLPNYGIFSLQFAGGKAQVALSMLALAGIAATLRNRRALVPAVLWAVVYYAAMLFSKVPAFGWYFVPPMPVFHLLAALGTASLWDYATRWLQSGSVMRLQVAAPFFVLLAALPLAWHVRSIERDVADAQRLEDEVRRPLGLWLREHTGPFDRILLEPIGTIGYYSGRRILDLVGLVSPEVLPSYRSEVPSPLADIVERFAPEVLVLREGELRELLQAKPELAAAYREEVSAAGQAVFTVLRKDTLSLP